MKTTTRAKVLYDGDCPFCIKSIALLRRLDWNASFDYIDLRGDDPILRELPGNQEALLEQMHVVPPDGKMLDGFHAIRWLMWRLPAVCVLTPFLYLPGIPTLGQRLYLFIARNRFRLVPCRHGVCTIERPGNTRSY